MSKINLHRQDAGPMKTGNGPKLLSFRRFASPLGLCMALVLFSVAARTAAQRAPLDSGPSLTIDQILLRMQAQEESQSKNLAEYAAQRQYSVVYRGFHKTIQAQMVVKVEYKMGVGKSFQVVSQSGSRMLFDKVLKKAIESEREASSHPSETALNRANYRFDLAGTETMANRPAYVLAVKPTGSSKFLYKGKLWVDGVDFAVRKMEVEPAKNPSFWITKTLIHHENSPTQGFWLPRQNRSESTIRIGGKAVLTIDYGTYQIQSQRNIPKAAVSSGH